VIDLLSSPTRCLSGENLLRTIYESACYFHKAITGRKLAHEKKKYFCGDDRDGEKPGGNDTMPGNDMPFQSVDNVRWRKLPLVPSFGMLPVQVLIVDTSAEDR
jgi:hypothetical protein